MTTPLAELKHELRIFLERLGLTVEDGDRGALVATRRTALTQERTEFRVLDRPPSRVAKASRVILPDSVTVASGDSGCIQFSSFLDSTIQADRIAQDLDSDPLIRQEEEFFIPQRIQANGQARGEHAIDYFFKTWLPDPARRLLVVLAPAGYGKTVLTRILARRLAGAHLASTSVPKKPFPFLVPFGQFRRVAEFEQMILSALHRQGITDFTAGAFAHLVQRQRLVLLLDGFDELLEERPDEAGKNLRELIEMLAGQGRIVLTARATFFRTSADVSDFLQHSLSADDVAVLDLLPFDAGQKQQLVQKLSPNQTTINRISRVLKIEGLREAMGSPLLLRETIDALAQGGAGSRLDARARPRDVVEILEPSVYERERVRHGHLFTDRVQRSFIESLAKEMLHDNVRGFDMTAVKVLALEASALQGEFSEEDVDTLADHHFLTVDYGSDEVRFNHQFFRELFQARALMSAVERSDQAWLLSVLSMRPLPEAVAGFVGDLAKEQTASQLLKCVGDVPVATGYLAPNLAAICTAFRSPGLLRKFLETVDRSVPLGFRVEQTNLEGFDWSGRVLNRMEFEGCNLRAARFAGSTITEIAFHQCDLMGADFGHSYPEAAVFDYGPRIFGALAVADALHARGAAGVEEEAKVIQDLTEQRRSKVRDLLLSRLRRFWVPGPAGPEGAKWDLSILEKNVLGGLPAVDRRFASSELIPEMEKCGILERRREHNQVVYGLADGAKDFARRFIEDDVLEGPLLEVLDRLAPISKQSSP